MGAKYAFDKKYKISLPSREDWLKGRKPAPCHGEVWFTDGSRRRNRAGLGVYRRSNSDSTSLSLGEYTTVFQAEVLAILVCAQKACEAGILGEDIGNCSDSQAALKALDGWKITSKLVWDCRLELNGLAAKGNRVTLY